ncbi:hypothetical protein ACSU64_04425 [Bacillaceae bacterium C204]|uniref:hypothetical protein n=1 Tax=Neobacillus sp. 204 TaxID=3383351 RepID=UPI003978E38F
MNKQKYYLLDKKLTFSTYDLYEAASLLFIREVELGLLSVEKKDGEYLVTYRVNFPEVMQTKVDQTREKYSQKTLMVNVRYLHSKITYLLHLHHKKIKEFKLHQERDGME